MAYLSDTTQALLNLKTSKRAALVFALTNGLILSLRRLMKRNELDAMLVREAQIRLEAAHRCVNNLLR